MLLRVIIDKQLAFPPSPYLIWNHEAVIHVLRKAGFDLNGTVKVLTLADGSIEYTQEGNKHAS